MGIAREKTVVTALGQIPYLGAVAFLEAPAAQKIGVPVNPLVRREIVPEALDVPAGVILQAPRGKVEKSKTGGRIGVDGHPVVTGSIGRKCRNRSRGQVPVRGQNPRDRLICVIPAEGYLESSRDGVGGRVVLHPYRGKLVSEASAVNGLDLNVIEAYTINPNIVQVLREQLVVAGIANVVDVALFLAVRIADVNAIEVETGSVTERYRNDMVPALQGHRIHLVVGRTVAVVPVSIRPIIGMKKTVAATNQNIAVPVLVALFVLSSEKRASAAGYRWDQVFEPSRHGPAVGCHVHPVSIVPHACAGLLYVESHPLSEPAVRRDLRVEKGGGIGPGRLAGHGGSTQRVRIKGPPGQKLIATGNGTEHLAGRSLGGLVGLSVAGIISQNALRQGEHRILIEVVQGQLESIDARAYAGRPAHDRTVGEGEIGGIEAIDLYFLATTVEPNLTVDRLGVHYAGKSEGRKDAQVTITVSVEELDVGNLKRNRVDPKIIDQALEGSVHVVVLLGEATELQGEGYARIDALPDPVSAHGSVHADLDVGSGVNVSHVSPLVPDTLIDVDVRIPTPVLGTKTPIVAIPEGTDCPKLVSPVGAGPTADPINPGLVLLTIFDVHPKGDRTGLVPIDP